MRRNGGAPGEGGGAPWPAIVVTWLSGVVAAFGLGVLSPLGSEIRQDLGLSLGRFAWATSSITAVSAVLGVPAGWWISRLDARRAVAGGLLLTALSVAATALAPGWPALLAARTAQGFGYLLVFVGGPIVLTRLAEGRAQATALALWGTCVPSGLALATALGGAVSGEVGWRGWIGATAVLPLALAVATAAVVRGAGAVGATRAVARAPAAAEDTGGPSPHTGWTAPVLFALSFACVCLAGVAIVVLLPTFLTEQRGASAAAAGAVAAVVSLGSVVGSALSGWPLRRGVGLLAVAPVLVLLPVAALLVFGLRLPPAAVTVLACAGLVVDGVLISVMFASVPRIAGTPGRADVTNGLLAQCGSLGTLVGPPAFSAAVDGAGWIGAGLAALGFTAAGIGLLLAAVLPAPRGSARLRPRGAAAEPARGSTAVPQDRTGGRDFTP
ncbi:MFS transporter [Kitasatospora sp. NPDC018619]|uniref:MFS transporter n=1 Tax=unclassified Kitasatospora TaxID=2633591 RepID=UPI0037B3EC78